MKKTLALEFATNMFGNISPDIKKRLEKVIKNPTQKNWENAYSIIINSEGRMTTLWQAVIKIDWSMPISKPLDAEWSYLPTSETILEAIKNSTLKKQSIKHLN